MLFRIIGYKIRQQLKLNAVGISFWSVVINKWQKLFYSVECPFVLFFCFNLCHDSFLSGCAWAYSFNACSVKILIFLLLYVCLQIYFFFLIHPRIFYKMRDFTMFVI